ncbi:hypothetical protein DFQ28_008497 [Apophysomyces sp. BC1034]|nr:hypothetical protein DFQ30_009292 [Apophysomyces sp. BC1015]KAG0181820.1 hypothetical protein DFQ29_006931 [Apophysomyces sp. BC1021]KAG0192621.1 hypothetical protein DFQ28_008497 [Apophysomyces sp. BC1034]
MASRPQPRSQQRPTLQAKRYRAGQVPEDYVDELSDSEEEEERQQQQQQKQQQTKQSSVQFAQKEVVTGLKQIEISEKDVASDRRLRRLKEAQESNRIEKDDQGRRRRRHFEDEAPKEEEEEDEEERARYRIKLKQQALQQQREREEALAKQEIEEEEGEQGEEEEEEEESSSEYETDSSEDEGIRRMPRPTFIPRTHRQTILQQEKLAKEAEEREKRLQEELEERKKQSHDLLAEELKREKDGDLDEDLSTHHISVDDTDGLDEEAEYEAWKVRELMRIKRDREERIAREKEQEEIERRRELPEDVRLKEDMERADETRNKDKGQHTYLQKYYHKGAFYQDMEADVFKRDYSAPTTDEVRNKDLLPEVMQVKNFGLAGRTKWTHLTAEDTTSFDDPWQSNPPPKKQKRE